MNIEIRGHRGPAQWILRVHEPRLLAQRAGNGETLSEALRSLADNLERHAMDALCQQAKDADPPPLACEMCGTTTEVHYDTRCRGPG